jgi:hypothetical protein
LADINLRARVRFKAGRQGRNLKSKWDELGVAVLTHNEGAGVSLRAIKSRQQSG